MASVTEQHVGELKFDPHNARRHTQRGATLIENSISADGFGRSVLLAADGTILAGNQTVETASQVGMENVIVVESDGTQIIAVKRVDVQSGSERALRLSLADNRATDLSQFDPGLVAAMAELPGIDLMWSPKELESIAAMARMEEFTARLEAQSAAELTTEAGEAALSGEFGDPDRITAGAGAGASVGATHGDIIALTFPFTAQERSVVVAAIDRWKQAHEGATGAQALAAICGEWVNG